VENIQFRSGAINASECLKKGWEMIKPNYGIFLGMVVLELVIVFAVNMIPYIGEFIDPLITGAILVGIYYALLRQMRNESVEFAMMFSGFQHFVPAALVALIGVLPWFFLWLGSYIFPSFPTIENAINNGNLKIPTDILREFGTVGILTFFVVWIMSVALQLVLFFALPLIADRGLGFFDAVKLSVSAAINNLGGLIVLTLLQLLASLIGVLAFCVGIIFVIPVIYASNVVAYRSVFPENQMPSYYTEPPQPGAYGGTYGRPM
jgi:hypothetical protein